MIALYELIEMIQSFVRERHSRVALIRNTRESYSSAIVKELKAAKDEVLPFLSLGSHYLNRFIYNTILCGYMAVYDYDKIIIYCEQALRSIPTNHRNKVALRNNYMQMKIPALVALGRLEEAKEIAKESINSMPGGNFNWHIALIRRIIICLHSEEYQEAYDLYKAHCQQERPYPILKEYWQIIWGYLYFLIQVGKVEEYTEERFHLGKFLNEMPIYSKDKEGNNINLLIIQIITHIQREEYGKIINRIESLSMYVRKYTKTKETRRANIFINMILKMEAASFHRAGTELKTRQLYQKLQNTPLRLDQNLAIEVIPYEVLWSEILKLLENKFRRIRTKKSSISKINPSKN